jgi:hypothetical protein
MNFSNFLVRQVFPIYHDSRIILKILKYESNKKQRMMFWEYFLSRVYEWCNDMRVESYGAGPTLLANYLGPAWIAV